MIKDNGEGLIFILSQPRAGSTLLQRMLGSHPEIHTVQEPWIALYPLYSLKESRLSAEFNVEGERIFRRAYLKGLPDGDKAFRTSLARMLVYLYNQSLEPTGKKYFLDKSPPYSSIFPELLQVFTKAQFVVLFRNPLAVLISMIRTWTLENWFALSAVRHDLLKAPAQLLDGWEANPGRVTCLRFEDLVGQPESTIRILCDKLSLKFDASTLTPGRAPMPRWTYGDQSRVYQDPQPNPKAVDEWKIALHHPQVWRLACEYFDSFEAEQLALMGYSRDEMQRCLEATRPRRPLLRTTFSLERVLSGPWESQSFLHRFLFRVQRRLHHALNFQSDLSREPVKGPARETLTKG